tara:strand:+ start:2436 stop:3173 length:738 start_codon:yes stop_codon:yes gene_type:complete
MILDKRKKTKKIQNNKKNIHILKKKSNKKNKTDSKKIKTNSKKNKTISKKNKSDKMDLHKQFKPNLTPYQVMKMGSFGGTYYRPIKSGVTHKDLKNQHKKYNWDLPNNMLTLPFDKYDISINKYKVKVGTTLDFWESKGWITKYDPYGWFQWYCNYHSGRRCPDDERQIKRWSRLAGPKGRFKNNLITLILKKKAKGEKTGWNDETVSPKIRQTLQHWGYKLTKADFDKEVERRKKTKTTVGVFY